MENDCLKIIIREMVKEDVPQVSEIEKDAFGNHRWHEDAFYTELNNELSKYLVATLEDGTLIGFIGCWLIFEEAHVATFAVARNYQRKQIAQALMCAFVDICYKEEIKYITLEVRGSNDKAISLYEKFGMTSVGIRKNYYQDNNESALIMFSENIFYNKFKTIYNEIKNNIKKIEIIYG